MKNLVELLSIKASEEETCNENTKAKIRVPQPKRKNLINLNPIPHGVNAEERPLTKKKAQNVLFVGDSIAGNSHLPTIENAVDADVKLVKAYSSIFENTHTAAHSAPKFPHKNFEDVITNEMNKSKYDTLIIQAGSVDITNLKTDAPNANEYLEYFKQKTLISAKNLFQTAVKAESKHSELEKIVLMKQTPRYDSNSSNPPGLKPYLSQLFNEHLDQLCNSAQNSKIMVGNHDLECHGGVFEARYRDNQSNRFDGVHLYGPSGMKAYTTSVLNILSSAQLVVKTPPRYYDQFPHMNCPQARYQGAQKTRILRQEGRAQYSVTTQNRYSTLGDWVQGNY